MIDLSVRIGTLELTNPVMVASGCFGTGREYSEIYDINRLGGIITKTVTVQPRMGNPMPRVWETPSGMLNSIGLANPGIDKFLSSELPFLEGLECVRIVSVAGATLDDYAKLVERLDGFDSVDGFEVNVSCPNVKLGGLAFGTDSSTVHGLTKRLRALTDKPLWIKLTPNVTDIVEIGKAAVEGGADALVAINTLIAMDIDINSRKPRLGNITGGLSGPSIRPVALAKIFALHREMPDVPIIGVGGIGEPADAIAHLIAGATAVEIGSGQFPRPLLPLEVLEGIIDYCEVYGYTRTSDLIGDIVLP